MSHFYSGICCIRQTESPQVQSLGMSTELAQISAFSGMNGSSHSDTLPLGWHRERSEQVKLLPGRSIYVLNNPFSTSHVTATQQNQPVQQKPSLWPHCTELNCSTAYSKLMRVIGADHQLHAGDWCRLSAACFWLAQTVSLMLLIGPDLVGLTLVCFSFTIIIVVSGWWFNLRTTSV